MQEYSGDERESQRSGGGATDRSSVLNLHNKPTYLLEHLATFTVNKESGIMYPADGMRRLLQLEKTTGIWSQKMQLCLDYPWVLIMDYETENIIEKFPATLIQEPTAFTSTDAMELYNNILVFIVSSGGSGSRSEMHIFQSQNVSAVNLVEDLKQLRNGKHIIKQHQVAAAAAAITTNTTTGTNNNLQQHDTDSDRGGGGGGDIIIGNNGMNDETSSTSSDKYERDVTVLNHCFDDIEKFIARLQHAAAALRELERRRRNRKTKKKDIGEGLLTLRTRPPHEKEFLDIFAKFKLSFNLLAKLKSHIHDPNAPELVHFLFTPLALIVEAANDTYYEAQLPAHVINPLLTREAINLLINCVTSKETELWRSLGDAWTVPRDQWKDEHNLGTTYHPVFMDGWSPDYLVIDELEQHGGQSGGGGSSGTIGGQHGGGTPSNLSPLSNVSFKKRLAAVSSSTNNNNEQQQQQHLQSSQQQQYRQHQQHYQDDGHDVLDHFAVYGDNNNHHQHHQIGGIGGYDFSARSKMSMDSIEHESPHDAITTTTTTSTIARNNSNNNNNHNNNDKIIGAMSMNAITAGMQNMQTNIYDGTLKNNHNNNHHHEQYSGIDEQQQQQHHSNHHSHHQLQQPLNNNIITSWLDDLQANNAKIVLVTYPRTANNDKELSVVRGEYLEVLDDTRKWWKARNIRGQVAHVPHTIVTPYNYDDMTDAPLPPSTTTPPTHFKTNYNSNNNNGSSKFSHSNQEQIKDSIANSQIGINTGDNNSQWNRNKHLGKKGEFRYF